MWGTGGFSKRIQVQGVILVILFNSITKWSSNTISRYSSVSVVTGLLPGFTGDQCLVLCRSRDFSLLNWVQTDFGAHLAACPMGTAVCFPGIKRPGEADYSPPVRVEVKYLWSYTSSPPYLFMVRCSNKSRDDFAFTFIFLFSILLLMWRQ